MGVAVLIVLGMILVLGTTGSSNVVVRSEINQDIEPLQRSILLLKRDNAQLRARADQTDSTLARENAQLKASVATLERKLLALHSPGVQTGPADAGVVVGTKAPPKRAAAVVSSHSEAQPSPAPAAAVDPSIEFNRERAHRVATNGQLLLTFVNKIRLDFATTWVFHVRRLGMTNWLVGSTDKFSLRELQRIQIPTFDMQTNLPEHEWPWGSPSFKSLGARRRGVWDLLRLLVPAFVSSYPPAAPRTRLRLLVPACGSSYTPAAPRPRLRFRILATLSGAWSNC